MRAGAVVVLIALVLGFLVGRFLRPAGWEPGTPTVVDTVLQQTPAATAHADSVLHAASATLDTARVKDSTASAHEDSARALGARIAAREAARRARQGNQPNRSQSTAPGDTASSPLGECTEDLADRTEQVNQLQQSTTACREAQQSLTGQVSVLSREVLAAQIFRRDTVPHLITVARNEPRPCKEDWGLFKVKCSTGTIVKLIGGFTLGVAATR